MVEQKDEPELLRSTVHGRFEVTSHHLSPSDFAYLLRLLVLNRIRTEQDKRIYVWLEAQTRPTQDGFRDLSHGLVYPRNPTIGYDDEP
jgi:hypothetical protein